MTDETPRCEPPPEWRDRDGWHWVQCMRGPNPDSYEPEPVYWYSVERRDDGRRGDIGEGWRYVAPVTPPAVVEAMAKALEGLQKEVTNLLDAAMITGANRQHMERIEGKEQAAKEALAAYRGEA